MMTSAPPSGNPPPFAPPPPPGSPPPPPDKPPAGLVTVPMPNEGEFLVKRFWLFVGPVFTEGMSEDILDMIESAPSHGWHSFAGANRNLDLLIGYARDTYDPDEVWWHIVDAGQQRIVWDSETDRQARH